jgi:hypothetical protein
MASLQSPCKRLQRGLKNYLGDKTMKTFVLVISVLVMSSQSLSAVLPADNFNDNAMDSLWTLYESNHASCQAVEANQRLEFRATGSPTSEQTAGYVSNGWKLSPDSNFQLKITYHYSKVTWNDGGLGISLSPDETLSPTGNYFQAGVGCDEDVPYMGYNIMVNGSPTEEYGGARSSDDGTVYISYDSPSDTLRVSAAGYSSGDALYRAGLLKGNWGGADVSVLLVGYSAGVVVASGEAYGDNFVVDQGTIVTLPPSAPTSVAATDGAYTDKVAITWTASSGATAYDVYRNTSNNSASSVQINVSDVAGTSYDDTSAVAGTTYWYWVKAKNAGGASGFSAGDSGYRLTVTATTFLPDFNGDGKTDILWRNTATGSCLIQLMNGTSTISRGTIGGDLTWEVAGLGDFNNDGKTDILWRKTTTGSCLIQLMNGVSTMSRGTVGGDLTWEPWGPADFNGDNKADILWRKTTTGSCLIQLMNGVSTISRGTVGGDLTWEPWGLGDFNHDHMMDILWCKTTTGSCLIQLMNGVSTISRGTVGGDLTWEPCDIGDFNYDNKSDILWRNTATGSCLIQLMNGVSTISRGTVGGDLTWNVLISGDFNDDHMTDILWRRTTTGSCLIQLMNGTSTISRGTVGGDLTWEVLNVGDFNGDQKADIFWRKEATGSCLIQLMNGVSTIGRGTIGGDLTWEVIAP